MRSRIFPIALVAAIVVVLSGCSQSPVAEAKDGKTLMAIAQVFNDDYGRNNDGAVYDRWDIRSQAVITRADYIRRHAVCATAPQQTAHVESAVQGVDGSWLVRYEISGLQFTDYWFYIRGTWVFDIILSNPAVLRLYRLPYKTYIHQLGCLGK
jgi:hypothetical protein